MQRSQEQNKPVKQMFFNNIDDIKDGEPPKPPGVVAAATPPDNDPKAAGSNPPEPPFAKSTPSVPPQGSSSSSQLDQDLDFIMAIPFEFGMQNGRRVMRADLSRETRDIDLVQEKLKAFGLESETGASSIFPDGALKVDADTTAKFEGLQNVFLQNLEKRNLLAFGATGADKTVKNAARIDMKGVHNANEGQQFKTTARATMQTLNRINQLANSERRAQGKPEEVSAYTELGSSSLFPDSPNMVMKIDNPVIVDKISTSVATKPAPVAHQPKSDYKNVQRF